MEMTAFENDHSHDFYEITKGNKPGYDLRPVRHTVNRCKEAAHEVENDQEKEG